MDKPITTQGLPCLLSDANDHFAASLMVQLVVPAFVLDVQGRVMIWNHACEKLTGIPAEEVLGTSDHWRGFYHDMRLTLADLVVSGRTELAHTIYARAQEGPGECYRALSAAGWCDMPRTGSRRYLVMDAGPIYDKAGALLGALETWRDMTVQKEAQHALERLAMYDGLTGIANRRCFDQTLRNEWEQARRTLGNLSLLLVDVDNFKQYNDTYGHLAGDECLKRVAIALSGHVRAYDMVARYGGEEFAFILPNETLSGAQTVAERVRVAVERSVPADLALPGGQTTVSIGAAACDAARIASPEELVACADAALYRAKKEGRNRVVAHQV